jgi:DNA-binding LacI/PurR family transcriptional regulator
MARVRLVDVAERAQVSMKTVSNVVNGYAHVQPDMRARVQAAIDELGYRPNLTARRLDSMGGAEVPNADAASCATPRQMLYSAVH